MSVKIFEEKMLNALMKNGCIAENNEFEFNEGDLKIREFERQLTRQKIDVNIFNSMIASVSTTDS